MSVVVLYFILILSTYKELSVNDHAVLQAGDLCSSSTVFPAYSSAAETYIIARPPANNPAPNVSLATELDSFYSEVAALEPPPLPSPSPPPPSPPPVQLQQVEPPKKRKKVKILICILK